ncbi:C-type lectin domain family 1 member B-like [Sorex fumeus]|uniref:C-type lectin domain family 1 member B-like n=1 Tax=Sorex fumeus TaxID=62283 RepID=UPI0024ADCA28|nr:C-type lectin domain family 1 member B-like [Sorex fumeus]
MSNASDSEQPTEEITEETETILAVEPEASLALPPPPPPDSPQEDEWDQIPEHTNKKAPPFPTCLYGTIPVILGIFSVLLLMSGFFAFQYFQSVQESENKMKNFNQWMEFFQNNVIKSHEFQKAFNENKEMLKSLGNQNEYLIESLHESETRQEARCNPPQHPWVQHRGFCYFKTQRTVPWLNCSDLCVSLDAEFLRTERSKLTIIMNLLAVSHTWVGLSYRKEIWEWRWDNESSPSPSLHLPEPKVEFEKNCVYTFEDQIGTDDCNRSHSCMCEMKLR